MIPDIDRIISDYLQNHLSAKDEELLNKWLEEDPLNSELLNTLERVWKTRFPYPLIINMDDERAKLWSRLNGGNVQEKSMNKQRFFHTIKTKINLIPVLKVAATIAILLTIGYFLFHNLPGPQVQKPPMEVRTIDRINPKGQKSRIYLQDGSVITLNADSKITYTSEYNRSSRDIHLTGEAYFEVAKNKELPFRVITDDLVITAIGTSFNVQAFSSDNVQKVALRTGKVKVETTSAKGKSTETFLNPDEMAIYNESKQTISLSHFNGHDPFGWKDGRIIFDHATLDEVITTLERWYNVEIKTLNSPSRQWDFSSTYNNETLENILESLKFSENIEYKLDGSEVEIKL